MPSWSDMSIKYWLQTLVNFCQSVTCEIWMNRWDPVICCYTPWISLSIMFLVLTSDFYKSGFKAKLQDPCLNLFSVYMKISTVFSCPSWKSDISFIGSRETLEFWNQQRQRQCESPQGTIEFCTKCCTCLNSNPSYIDNKGPPIRWFSLRLYQSVKFNKYYYYLVIYF